MSDRGSSASAPLTYAGAGVDISAGERAVELIRPLVASTARPGVIGGIGGFGGLFALPTDRYRQPVLVATTDGVGTKLELARQAGRFDTVGIDLVAMCVDDLVCQGAEPLFFLDYLAVGRLDPLQVRDVVAGITEGCRQAGCALLGGEMAEHPGTMADDGLDLAGFAVGVVERDTILDGTAVRPGDALIGLLSPGLRSNGFSLARAVLERVPASERARLIDELLTPSVIYAPAVLVLLRSLDVRAVAHITGGGLPGNVPRALPPGTVAVLDRRSWAMPRVQAELVRRGGIHDDESLRVFNQGLGMIVVVAEAAAADALELLGRHGVAAARVGTVMAGVAGGPAEIRIEGPVQVER